MRIGLNLLHAQPEIGGGWNYIQNLVASLGEWDHSNVYFAFVTHLSESLVPTEQNFRKVLVKLNARSRPQRVIYEHSVLQWLVYRYRLDCLHWFANTQAVVNVAPSAVTIYDLQPFMDLGNYGFVKRTYLKLMVTRTAKHAPVLLPMSRATARDLETKLGVNPDRMTVIPPSLEKDFRPVTDMDVEAFRLKYHLPQCFWLYVAHFYPHKNHKGLLHAYFRLRTTGSPTWPLVFRGDPQGAEIGQVVDELGLEKDIVWLPRLERQEMPALYSSASALVFPSFYEGGGIPVLEAMACGCPVLASDIAAVREYAGEAAIYFDPHSVNSISEAMLCFTDNPEYQARLRNQGFRQVEKYQAQSVVSNLVAAYSKTKRRYR